jgi:signal transduction histidine kinase
LPSATSTAVFRIFQEILTNVARHAGASRIRVTLRKLEAKLFLQVQDNGCGITQEKLARSRSFGLLGMQERAWAIGGELEIHGSPRSGTTVTLNVPMKG